MSAFDFRAQQESSRRNSTLLTILFVVLVGAVSAAVGALVSAVAFSEFGFDVASAIGIAVATMAVLVAVAWVRVLMLGGDGARVAEALGGEEVTDDTRNAAKRRYLNVVDEMAIAAGMPRPRAFVIKHEQGINAFAAGAGPDRAAIGVTHGALAKLNREELAGVVAHEMAHIANHDTRLNTRLMGMVFALVVLYTIGRGVMRSMVFMPRRRNDQSALVGIALGVGLIVLGLFGVLAGRILQSAVSRRREYLADATGVQFTRNPSGLANALKKVGATATHGHVGNAHAEEARHMFFASATGQFAGLFATHPPLVRRIRALEPAFDPASDPVWNMDDRTILRETRRELVGPWG